MVSDTSPLQNSHMLGTAEPPTSRVFNEGYWTGGAAEKEFVFVQGNNLPQRLTGQPLTVAELGFGTGLNLMLTSYLANQQATPLTFVSYELYPLSRTELEKIHAQFPAALAAVSGVFLSAYAPQPGWNVFRFATTTLHLYVGDAAEGMGSHPKPADCWFLDGFSPATNPAMWQPELMAQVFAHTKAGGSATTYSAAGMVKHALVAAGFQLERVAGFPPKRHMLKAKKLA